MKKRVCILLIIILLFSIMPLILADEESEKSYSCLKEKLGTNCGDTANTEQAAFSLLAMAYDSPTQSDCKASLKAKKNTIDNCWGKTQSDACNIKTTALAVLALKNTGSNVDESINFLLNNRRLTDDLVWYLQIDANEETNCKLWVDDESTPGEFSVNEDKVISGSPDSTCFSLSQGGYFLKIEKTCLESNFTIECDKNFITTLLYKESAVDPIFYVSSETHYASANDQTQERVKSYCFSNPMTTKCDYEGSLWAALALAKSGEEFSPYVPYISSKSDNLENTKYSPDSFLYMLIGADDYYSNILSKQKYNKYWKEGVKNDENYDTALALLSLKGLNLNEIDDSKTYLLSKRGEDSCWDNLLNTAFILYAGWGKEITSISEDGETSGYEFCDDAGFFCVSPSECETEDLIEGYDCFGGLSDVCCSEGPEQETCDEKNGITCQSNQQCTGSEVIAKDTNYCCLDSCVLMQEETTCEQNGYFCRSLCGEDEEEVIGYECNMGDTCCQSEEGKKSPLLLIILLVILIILVVLAIIFREQLKVWFFKIKSKLKKGKGPGPTKRPMGPPGFLGGGRPRGPPRRPPMRNPAKDKDFRNTMSKLRRMSK